MDPLFLLTPVAFCVLSSKTESPLGLPWHVTALWLCATLSPTMAMFPNSDSANLVCVKSHSTFCVSEESQFSTNWDLFTLLLSNTYC